MLMAASNLSDDAMIMFNSTKALITDKDLPSVAGNNRTDGHICSKKKGCTYVYYVLGFVQK
jgi:hypothetical protein